VLALLGFAKRVSDERRAQLADPLNHVFVSVVSPWEIELKRAKGRLQAPDDLGAALSSAALTPLSVTLEHAIAAGRLPLHHADPFDRMLVAQAQLEGLTLVTNDKMIPRYQVAVLPA